VAAIEISPITEADAPAAARFLHEHLNPAVTADAWTVLLRPPWGATGPNSGFQLHVDGALAGVYAAGYAERAGADGPVATCNLAAFCVLEPHRMHSLRLVRALLKQPGYVFTDFSPSGNVVAMNERLGFHRLETGTRLVVNLPRPGRRGVTITEDPGALAATLAGADADVHRDHAAAPAAHHLLVRRGDEYAYLVFRADARRGLRIFATPLYAGGSTALLRDAWGPVRAHLLRRHRLVFTVAERRILSFADGIGRDLPSPPRERMVRGDGLAPERIDYLYSELALVSW
jgi:hypothetical protein